MTILNVSSMIPSISYRNISLFIALKKLLESSVLVSSVTKRTDINMPHLLIGRTLVTKTDRIEI